MRDADTIVALSSGGLPAGVAIIRLSGHLVPKILSEVVGKLPSPRNLEYQKFKAGSEIIDQGLVAFFPAPFSFTGEDCAELHAHGSVAVVRALLNYLSSLDGVRLADPGEFTRRAFENGKMDLVEVEGLSDLIIAETENQREIALSRMSGGLTHHIESWRQQLLALRAEIEARLDFSDEGDVAEQLPRSFQKQLRALDEEFRTALKEASGGRIIREGFRVALAGLPNAGKSSLINALVDSDLAIVSTEAGTTRDVREVPLDIDGQLVIFVDMAGLTDTDSIAEAEGVRRARQEIAQADLVLWLLAPDQELASGYLEQDADYLVVGSKSDLGDHHVKVDLRISIIEKTGLDALMDRVKKALDKSISNKHSALLCRVRDQEAISTARERLKVAIEHLNEPEIAADALRQSSDALARLLGKLDPEHILGEIFSSFCIGK